MSFTGDSQGAGVMQIEAIRLSEQGLYWRLATTTMNPLAE